MRYEVRAMSFGEILDTGFRLVTNHFVLLAAIAAIVYVPLAVIGGMMTPDADGTHLIVAAVAWLAAMSLSPVVTGAITYAIGEVYLGREVTIGGSLRVGFALFVRLVGTWLLASLAILGGLLLLVVPGIYVALCLMLATQVMVFERVFGTAALRRSRELMRGDLLRGFGIVLLVTVLTTVLSGGVELALATVPLLAPLGSGIVQAVSMAYGSAVMVLLYFDIRSRKEAFDLEHLVVVVESDARSGPLPSPAV